MTEKEMKERLYGLYQLDWMMERGYTLQDVMKGMNSIPEYHDSNIQDRYKEVDNGDPYGIRDVIPDGMQADIEGIFNSWIYDGNAFGGERFVCFDEFCNSELTIKGYIDSLIKVCAFHKEELQKAYNDWFCKQG